MPKFSNKSRERLAECHDDLQQVMNEAIKEFDFTVLCGYRTPAEQLALYKKGRTEPGQRVTNIDGYNIKSRHNYKPALAVDIAPWPIDWNDLSRFETLAHIVKAKAKELNIKITWGGDWKDFKDYPHFELDL